MQSVDTGSQVLSNNALSPSTITVWNRRGQIIYILSQVCNLAWSKHASELVSTHGYSQNQILVWKYPSLVQVEQKSFRSLHLQVLILVSQVAKLTGHSYRVLYLAMSPDGEAIVTGAGDETLRFWNVFRWILIHFDISLLLSLSVKSWYISLSKAFCHFSKARSQKESKSALNLFTSIR